MKFWVRVRTKEQFQAALEYNKTIEYNKSAKEDEVEITRFILNYSCAFSDDVIESIKQYKAEQEGVKFYYQMPDVYREEKHGADNKIEKNVEENFDGVVIKNLDELGLIIKSGYSKEVIADAFLYAMNSQAVDFYKQLIPEMKFISNDELTNEEYNSLVRSADNESDFVIKAYGHQCVMITAQCMNKNYRQCKKGTEGEPSCVTFTDEFNDGYIAISNCDECYSMIYKEQPTCFILKVWKKYENILLDFTLENKGEVKSILGNKSVDDYSLGHFKQGID